MKKYRWLYCILMLGTNAVYSTELTSQFTGNLLRKFAAFGYPKFYFKISTARNKIWRSK